MAFYRFLDVSHIHAAFQRVQPGNLQRLGAHVQPGDLCAFARHAFRQNAAAAAHVEDGFVKNAAGTLQDVVQTQRVDTVQRLEFTFQIPPARGHGLELGDFMMVYVLRLTG
ncbi:hypothetical protein D3C78_1633760 [compost metagenome]